MQSSSLDVPSQYLDYGSNKSQLRPKPDFFRVGLAKAKTILNAPQSEQTSNAATNFLTNPNQPKQKAPRRLLPPQPYQYHQARVPSLVPPVYETYRGARMEILMERGTLERQRRVKATMGMSQSFKHDRQFLELILNKSVRTKADAFVHSISRDTLAYIDTRNVYWKQKIPEHVENTSKKVIKDLDRKPHPPRTQALVDKIVKELTRITQMMELQHYERVIKATKKLVHEVNSAENAIPGKESILSNCSSILGNAYLELKDEKKALAFHMQDLRIASEANLPVARARALDNLGRVYARTGQFQKAIQVWSEKMNTHPDMPPEETVWICHELGYCYLRIADFDNARAQGERSYAAAKKTGDRQWQLNASMLIAQAMLSMSDVYGCKQAFEKALKAAVKAGDAEAEQAVTASLRDIEKAIDTFREREVESQGDTARSSVDRHRPPKKLTKRKKRSASEHAPSSDAGSRAGRLSALSPHARDKNTGSRNARSDSRDSGTETKHKTKEEYT